MRSEGTGGRGLGGIAARFHVHQGASGCGRWTKADR